MKLTEELLKILRRVINEVDITSKYELEAVIENLDNRQLSDSETYQFDIIRNPEVAENGITREVPQMANTTSTVNSVVEEIKPPVVEQPIYAPYEKSSVQEEIAINKKDNTMDILSNANSNIVKDNTVEKLTKSNPVANGSAHHQYMADETEIHTNSSRTLILTTHRLFYQNSDTTIALAVDEISFIGYKRQTIYLMMIFGAIISLAGIYGASISKGGYVFAILGIIMIIFSRTKLLIFATGGGEMSIQGDGIVGDLRIWIDKIFWAKENLIKLRK